MTRWTANKGRQPPGTTGKRVFVRLRNGDTPAESWAADGKNACRWTLTDQPFDVTDWRLVE